MDKHINVIWIVYYMIIKVSSFEILINPSSSISANEEGWISCTVIDKPPGNYVTQLIRGESEEYVISSECSVSTRFLHFYQLQDDCDPTEQFFNLTIKEASCVDDTLWTCRFFGGDAYKNTTRHNVTYEAKQNEMFSPEAMIRRETIPVLVNSSSNCLNPDGDVTWTVDWSPVATEESNYLNDTCDCGSSKVESTLTWNLPNNDENLNHTFCSTVDNGIVPDSENSHIEEPAETTYSKNTPFDLTCVSICMYPEPHLNWAIFGEKLDEDIQDKVETVGCPPCHMTKTSTLTTQTDLDVANYTLTVSGEYFQHSVMDFIVIYTDSVCIWCIILAILILMTIMVVTIAACCYRDKIIKMYIFIKGSLQSGSENSVQTANCTKKTTERNNGATSDPTGQVVYTKGQPVETANCTNQTAERNNGATSDPKGQVGYTKGQPVTGINSHNKQSETNLLIAFRDKADGKPNANLIHIATVSGSGKLLDLPGYPGRKKKREAGFSTKDTFVFVDDNDVITLNGKPIVIPTEVLKKTVGVYIDDDKEIVAVTHPYEDGKLLAVKEPDKYRVLISTAGFLETVQIFDENDNIEVYYQKINRMEQVFF